MKGIDITKKVTNAEKAIFSEKALAAKKRRCTRVSMNNIDNNLIGYTLLRKRYAYQNDKPLIYYYFDSFIIHKKFRKRGLAKILILFNNNIIKKLNKHSFLTCPKKITPFYLKFNWKILTKDKFKIMDHKSAWFRSETSQNGMTYKLHKKSKKKIFYYLKISRKVILNLS